jgi:hypothetical protein
MRAEILSRVSSRRTTRRENITTSMMMMRRRRRRKRRRNGAIVIQQIVYIPKIHFGFPVRVMLYGKAVVNDDFAIYLRGPSAYMRMRVSSNSGFEL